jgi:hypothetical protein
MGPAVGSDDTAPGEEDAQRADFEEEVERIKGVQERYTERLLSVPGVVGTAVGLMADGEPAVKLFTRGGITGVPSALEGVPVITEATGEFFAVSHRSGGQGASTIDPTSRFTRPVPIGTSTGNQGECSAGTIGARVKAGSEFFALSNNHVYALENNAAIGSNVLQPGLYDTNCSFDANNVIGTLSNFVPINFNCACSFFSCTCDASKDNTVDAAIAVSSTSQLGNATPSNGYGIPRSTTAGTTLNQKVQKYGRTTSLTKGSVNGINATLIINYGGKYARFKGQFTVKASRGAFTKAGDSGSLIVTDSGRTPVGLLFAGNSNGSTAIANSIGPVLAALGVTIDGN